MARENLVQLHVHSEFSILDGCGKQDGFIARAVELGHPAVCFSEHGSLRGIHKLHENSTAAKIKPLYAVEFYAALNHRVRRLPEDEWEKIRAQHEGKLRQNKAARERELELNLKKRFHVTAIAKTDDGLRNLYKLSSKAWLDGFYMRPRIDLDLLEEHGDGLIVLSGCLDGFINQAILAGDMKKAKTYVKRFKERWGDDFYLEIMPNRLDPQKKVNAVLARFARRFGVRLVATTDVHYILKSDWQTHEVLLCVNTRRKMSDPNRWTFGCRDFWFQSRDEMFENFTRHHPTLSEGLINSALDATVEIANKCNAKLDLDRFRALLPEPTIPKTHVGSDFKYLTELCFDGWDFHDVPKRAEKLAKKRGESVEDVLEEYGARLKRELRQIRSQKVDRYFLIIREMYDWVHEQGIVCGPGRGSAGGSLVAYLLRLTDVDPVEHDLLFERFLNPDRIDLPDIDCDFEDRRRGEVVEYLRERYGGPRVAQISTVSRMTGKACLRDLARVLEIPQAEISSLINSIVIRSSGDERETQTIEDAIDEFEVGRVFDARYPDVKRFAKRLEGQARGLGLHAAGVIVSRDELTDWIPLESRGSGGERVVCTGVDMHGSEAQGLMKIDVLGLRTLSVVSDCLKAIEERHGKTIDLGWIDLNDPKVLERFTAGEFSGIFQFDTTSARKMCEGVNFERFDDIPAVIALDRPGPTRSGLARDYLERKQDPSKRDSIHPIIDKICSDTLGVIVYQEHIIKIFIEVAGFAPGTADSLRKKIAKRWGEEAVGKERENFVEGAVGRGFPRALAETVMDQISFFGSYGFNKSHATAYGLISYRQMFLKTYYPVEFMCALLANEPDHQRVMKLIREAEKMGIEVLQPDVDQSGETFEIVGEDILAGLTDLKGVGQAAVGSIVEHQPFTSFGDFVTRVELRKVHKGVIIALVKAGALAKFVPNGRWFLENVEDIWKKRTRKNWAAFVEDELDKSKSEDDYDESERLIVASQVSPLAFGDHPITLHAEQLDALPVDWATTAGEDIFDRGWGWIRGVITETRFNQIGEFHTGAEATPEQKLQKRWGARYASLTIEDASGIPKRIIVDFDIFDELRPVIERGAGTAVAALLLARKNWKNSRAYILIDVNELREKRRDGEKLTNIEAALVQPEKLFAGMKKTDLTRRVRRIGEGYVEGHALVVGVQHKPDKNLNEMGFVTLYGRAGIVYGLAFASLWPKLEGVLKVGSLLYITGKAQGHSFLIDTAKRAK